MVRTRKCFVAAWTALLAGLPLAALAEDVSYRAAEGQWASYGDGSAADLSQCDGCSKAGCNGACVGDSFCDPLWHIRLDGLFLDRSSSANTILARQTAPPNNVLLTAGDLSFSSDGAFRLSFLRDVDCGAWEISWLNGTWDSAAQVFDLNNLDAVAGTADFTDADRIAVSYFSDLDSIEFNRHWQTCSDLSLLAGLRYLSLDEIAALTATDAGQTSVYNTGTSNDLFGIQIGARWSYCLLSDVSFNLLAEGGVYYAQRSQDVAFRDNNNTPTFVYRNEDNGVAFVGEVDANVTWQVRQWLAVRGGFQYFWLQGMALAPEQFQSSLAAIAARPSPNSGSFDMYGGYLGVELSW